MSRTSFLVSKIFVFLCGVGIFLLTFSCLISNRVPDISEIFHYIEFPRETISIVAFAFGLLSLLLYIVLFFMRDYLKLKLNKDGNYSVTPRKMFIITCCICFIFIALVLSQPTKYINVFGEIVKKEAFIIIRTIISSYVVVLNLLMIIFAFRADTKRLKENL